MHTPMKKKNIYTNWKSYVSRIPFTQHSRRIIAIYQRGEYTASQTGGFGGGGRWVGKAKTTHTRRHDPHNRPIHSDQQHAQRAEFKVRTNCTHTHTHVVTNANDELNSTNTRSPLYNHKLIQNDNKRVYDLMGNVLRVCVRYLWWGMYGWISPKMQKRYYIAREQQNK